MKRTLAVFLSFLLILGLLPTAALATGEQVDAYLCDTAPTLDGVLSEITWYDIHELTGDAGGPAGTAGFLWNQEAIYIGMRQTGAETITLTIDGSQAVYQLSSGTFTSNAIGATAATTDGSVEFRIPFAALGVTVSAFGQTLPVKIEAASGTQVAALDVQLCLRGSVVYAADSCNSMTDKGYGEGTTYASADAVKIEQGDGVYTFQVPAVDGINSIRLDNPYYGGALDVEYTVTLTKLPVITDFHGWRGFVIEMRGTNGVRRFSLNKDTNGNVLFCLLCDTSSENPNGVSRTVDTGLSEGDTATIRISFDGNDNATLYVNGTQKHTFETINAPFASNTGVFLELQADNLNRTADSTIDVTLHDLLMTKPLYENSAAIAEDMLRTLTFDTIKGLNSGADRILSDLELPTGLAVPLIGGSAPLRWESSNPSILTDDGQVTGSASGAVTMTATLRYDGQDYTKEFDLTVPPLDADGCVMLKENDQDPYTGVLTDKGLVISYTLDQNLNSIGYDLGEVTTVNEVRLYDGDSLSRLQRAALSLYVSDDNVTYTRVKDWDLFDAGDMLILTNFETQCRYVKVHCHYEDATGAGFTKDSLQTMMAAGNNSGLPGAGGGTFEKVSTVTTSAAQASLDDGIVYIPVHDLGAPADAFADDLRDIRFVLDGKTLPYYFDDDGFYVRVPAVTSGQSVEIDVYGGNENAVDLSNLDSVFEVTYGNKTVMDLSTTESFFNQNIAVTTAPNGDLIAIGDDTTASSKLTMRRSGDGGRTWSDAVLVLDNGRMADGGGFLVDNGTIWYIFHHNNGTTLKVAVIRSEDNGYTWSAPTFVQTDHFYHVTYCDGVKTDAYDGEGPGVDYVAAYHFSEDAANDFKTSVIYSTDAGETWQSSKSVISYGGASAFESGVTEAAIAKLSNGDLLLLARCQYDGVNYLAKSISTDNGVTWQENASLSNVPSVNTMPAMENYGDDIWLLWAGNNNMGGTSYMRFPLTLAYSDDDAATWQQKLDLWTGTSKANYYPNIKGIQPSMDFTNYQNDGQDLFVAWWENWVSNSGLLIEDIDDYLYKTKGAADSFESTSAQYEGWNVLGGSAAISTERAADGSGSLKVTDTANTITRVNRSVPMMNAGEISFDLNLANATTGFYLELKSTFNNVHYKSDLMMVCVDSAGNIKAIDAETQTTVETLGTLSLNTWNRLTVKFDVEAETAELYLNGSLLGNLPVNLESTDGGVCYVQISDGSGQSAAGMTAYIDNFVAYEGVAATAVPLSDDCSVTDMTLTGIALDFSASQKIYPLTASSTATQTQLTVDTADAGAIITVNGEPYSDSMALQLAKGQNLFTVRVESASRLYQEEYVLVINRDQIDVAAVIGDVSFSSVANAVEAAGEDDVIVLQKNCAENLQIRKQLVIDCNGYDFTGTIVLGADYVRTDEDDRIVISYAPSHTPGLVYYTVTAVAWDHGTVTPASATVAKNGTVELTLKPDSGYMVSRLLVNGEDVPPSVLTNNGDGTYTCTLRVACDTQVRVNFERTGSLAHFEKQDLYTGFDDVDESQWFGTTQTGVIRDAMDLGIVDGVSDTRFMPYGNLKISEAIKIAAVIYSTYYDTDDTFDQTVGEHWYTCYVEYALEKGIIKAGDFANYDRYATRAEMAYIFANIMDAGGYAVINDVDYSKIPDVNGSGRYDAYILKLYRAGILEGRADYAFDGETNITRAEVCAIVTRLCDAAERIVF